MRILNRVFILLLVSILFSACSNDGNSEENSEQSLQQVSFILDWTPNTNHTGVYVAQEKGYFADEGLEVEVLLPGEVSSEQLVATGKGDFGVSYQEELIQARSEGLDVISIGAITQHSAAGYASPIEKGLETPKDFEGHVYGAYGTETESVMLDLIMERDNASIDNVETVLLGDADFFASTQRDIDFVSIFYGWTGIEAELRDVDLNFFYLRDYAEELDMYAPLITTSESMIENDRETVEKFMRAVSKGFEYTIDNPEEAANILSDAAPELDPELLIESSKWLAPQYQDEADQWGIQEESRWETVINFFYENDVTENKVDASEIFTNDFLPSQ